MTIEEFYSGADEHIGVFNNFVEEMGLVGDTKPDHICYKCDSKESFESIRALLEDHNQFMYQAMISGRRIAYIKLQKPFATVLGDIYFVELSDQKPNGSQTNKYDHIEVYPAAYSYDEMVQKLEASTEVIKIERPHHTTHDIKLENGFTFRCTEGPLIEKIKNTEM